MLKVAQCWDDGVTTDIRLTSILRKYHAKATFNLNPGFLPDFTDAPRWREPGEKGWSHKGLLVGKIGRDLLKGVYQDFQVASHCWKHETAGVVSDDEFLDAALSARKFLEETFDRECRGFAWPNGKFTPETCRLLREAGFLYGRTTLNEKDITKCADTLAIPTNCHFQSCEFWERYEEAKKTSGVFYFWGHSYETLNYEILWNDLEGKIRLISEDPEAEWVNVVDLVPFCHA